MTRTDLISAIEAAGQRHDIAPATVTSRGVGNSRLYHRLVRGGGCNVITAEKLISFIADLDAKRAHRLGEQAEALA